MQTFQAPQLKRLGRIHGSEEVYHAVAEIKAAGFKQFNLDLMHGLPEQTEAQALDDLNQAIGLEPSHLSWYQLTLEPNTLFYEKPPVLPEEDILAEIENQGLALLAHHGFDRYEISAFSRSGSQCRHNLNYWLLS